MVVESREVDAKSAADQVTMFIDGWSKDRPPVKEAAINLVDLAGSERRGKTGATGQRAKVRGDEEFKEGIECLTTLAHCSLPCQLTYLSS